MTTTIQEQITLSTTTCCVCGTTFAMNSILKDRLRETGDNFFCPVGHNQHFTDTMSEKLGKKETELRAAKCEIIRERNLREQAESKLKRVGAGVCPCCNRSFQNLRRHMHNKHKAFIAKGSTK